MKYAQIRKFDVTNGPGIRTTLFVSGCTHNCEGCFNKEQQSFTYGNEWTQEVEDSFIEAAKNPQIVGISILGGEPMQQLKDVSMLSLLNRLKAEVQKPIWMWTGYTFEELLKNSDQKRLLSYVDILIDGRFDITKRDLMLKYRGSSNQRVIDVKESLWSNKIVEVTFDEKCN